MSKAKKDIYLRFATNGLIETTQKGEEKIPDILALAIMDSNNNLLYGSMFGGTKTQYASSLVHGIRDEHLEGLPPISEHITTINKIIKNKRIIVPSKEFYEKILKFNKIIAEDIIGAIDLFFSKYNKRKRVASINIVDGNEVINGCLSLISFCKEWDLSIDYNDEEDFRLDF